MTGKASHDIGWAVAERWLIVEGSSLYRIRLTAAGQALLPPR
jgi:hypothetical protein